MFARYFGIVFCLISLILYFTRPLPMGILGFYRYNLIAMVSLSLGIFLSALGIYLLREKPPSPKR